MARLPLIINDQRLKTLEGLRENFNLTELLERYRGGQLRAWLNCWDFDSELEQLEALSSDLPEPELLTALCHIFGVEGDAKEQALTAFREEQEKREEQQQEAERQQKLREQEEQRKAEQTKPLTLDEIEFDWQVAEGPKVDFLTSGTNRFVAIQDEDCKQDKLFFYSYDGLHWEKTNFSYKGNSIEKFYYCNGNFIFHASNGSEVYSSSDFLHWNKVKMDEDGLTKNIIWNGDCYIAVHERSATYHYSTNGLFSSKTKVGSYNKPGIYTSEQLIGPWYKERFEQYHEGDSFEGCIWFNDRLILWGDRAWPWYVNKNVSNKYFIYSGSSLKDLTRQVIEEHVGFHLRTGMGKCFKCWPGNKPKSNTYITDDGINWMPLKYSIQKLLDTNHFLVALLIKRESPEVKGIGFHVSLDGINWRKLNAPLQNGKIAYLDGKLLIADGNKLAVGTLKIAHKNNTSSCSTHSSNTSTEDRDLHYNVELSTEEAKSGTIKEVTVTRSETCSLCSGSGRESGAGERSCTNCNGCGLVQGSKSIKVRIPADVKSGAKLRIRGQGNAGRGEAQPGDLYVHITVREEPSVSPSQTNSTNHTTPLKEIADAMNPLKNPAVLIFPAAGVTKAVSNILKNK